MRRTVILTGIISALLLWCCSPAAADKLVLTSIPPTFASAGRLFQHQIAVKSKAGGVKYKLETGPKGAKVSPTGQVRWPVPRTFNQATATLIISIKDAAGQEVLHTIDLILANLFRRKRT